jgi:hypothetical protein
VLKYTFLLLSVLLIHTGPASPQELNGASPDSWLTNRKGRPTCCGSRCSDRRTEGKSRLGSRPQGKSTLWQ